MNNTNQKDPRTLRETINDTCNACDAIGPTHPVTGYCKNCQEEI